MIKCCRCHKFIYDQKEATYLVGKKWHKSCFSCDSCGTQLYHNYNYQSDKLFCSACNLKTYGPTKSSYFMARWKNRNIAENLK
ncbi:unnamed protein product [Brachionus calyciflorus]|uniref:LIM zinc-binding domain-containing protein n=1 Tax=Brachionus calyciflorus TaxID=104777 RepID=A0A813MMR7_9BILA|nr:unnamed protein product [Brachionus calyciflorus]